MYKWASQLSVILTHLLQTIGVGVVPSLSNRGGSLVINDKIDRERGTFEPNMDVRGSIDWQEFKRVYNNVVKVDV